MKKIVLAAVVATALATPALAFDVKIKGDFNNRFLYSQQADVSSLNALSAEGTRYVNVAKADNPGLTNETGTDDADFKGEVKYRLIFDGTDDDKKARGVLALEFGGTAFGQPGSNKDSDGGTTAGGKTFNGLDFGGDDNNLELMWAYVDFELPFDPATRLAVGLQPVGLNKWVWSDNAAGVKMSSKRGELSYDLAWFRNDDKGFGAAEEERDVYALDVVYAPKDLPKFNLFGIYSWEDQAATSAGTADKDTQYWLGAAVDGQAGPLFYGATFVYEGGEIENLAGVDYDRKGYLFNAQGVYKIDKTRLTLGYLYVSGDDDATDKDAENYGNIDAYVPIGSVVIFDSYADDNTSSSSPYIQDKGYNMIYAGVDVDLNDKASVGASYFWHNTAEDLTVEDDKDLGHEVAVRASYKVTKNLTAGIQAGYLIGGDAWEALGTATDEGDDLFVTDASIRLKF